MGVMVLTGWSDRPVTVEAGVLFRLRLVPLKGDPFDLRRNLNETLELFGGSESKG